MRSIKTNQPLTLSRSTADRGVQRAVQFLRTVGTDPAIRTELQKVGFQEDDLKQGWMLVLRASAAPQAPARFTPDAGPVADATQKLEAWQSTMFLRAHAALRRLHPEQDAFVFADPVSDGTTTAVVAVSLFLERLDALENSADRKSTRKSDHAALATLARRGVTESERKQATHLVHVIETTAAPEVTSTPAPAPDVKMAALADVYAWVQDWSDSARAVITRRDHLIRLGIGKRRSRAATVAPQPAPAPVPEPVVTPAAPQLMSAPIAALPAKSNGMSNGAIHT
ncbi:MAG TPA: hypothetical protein VGH28_02375 [Polyangiaceae bacterium]|jgi:hypothetical protein